MAANKKNKSKSIEVEVQSKHYRPMTSKWFASGVVMVDGKPVYWKAARQYAKWDIESSAQQGWELDENQRHEAMSMIIRALQENRKRLSRVESTPGRKEDEIDLGDRITLAHGGGGTQMQELIQKTIRKHLPTGENGNLFDGAILASHSGRMVFATNTYVVKPLFFRGGNIGSAALYGTVNNIAVCAARPLAISVGLVLEEGLPIGIMAEILESIKTAAENTGVSVVTGDTRVVEKGSVDGMFINTTGIGSMYPRLRVGYERVKPGDAVLISGTVSEHGIAVICDREGLNLKGKIKSDVGPVNSLVEKLIKAKISIRCMKDPSRGGVAAALNQIATASGTQIEIDADSLPLRQDIADACEVMGLDPLSVANHGKLIVICAGGNAAMALEKLKEDPFGKKAAIIGKVTKSAAGRVIKRRKTGEASIVEMPYGEQMPRVL